MNLHLVMGLALLFEVAICLRARWHLGCRRYDTIGFAVVATHCRVVAVVFIYLGRLVLLGLRAGRYVVVKLGLVDKVVELAAGRYWRLHGHLEDRFIVLGVRYQRFRNLRKLNVRKASNSHTPLAIWAHGTGRDEPLRRGRVAGWSVLSARRRGVGSGVMARAGSQHHSRSGGRAHGWADFVGDRSGIACLDRPGRLSVISAALASPCSSALLSGLGSV